MALLLILALVWQAEHIGAFGVVVQQQHHPFSSSLTSVPRTFHQHQQHPENRQPQTAARKQQQQQNQFISRWQRGAFLSSSSSGADDSPSPPQEQSNYNNNNKPSVPAPPPPPPPMFNGKRVLPGSIVQAGLKASLPSRVVAVYAILVGGSSLEKIVHVGVTQDLYATLQAFTQTTRQAISHVRAQSFSSGTSTTTENNDGAAFLTPEQHLAMQDICQDWKQQAVQATGQELSEWTDPSAYLFSNDDDDEDEDDEEDDYDDYDDLDEDEKEIVDLFSQPGFQFRSSTPNSNSPPAVSSAKTTTTKDPEPSEPQEEEEKEIISPFATTTTTTTTTTTAVSTTSSSGGGANVLVFTTETVNQALDEIRPYLIADGGNVAVAGVDPDRWLVQLELQGACGSCPSSTVTMQMGIERVLKEQFGPNVVVEQVTPTTAGGGEGEGVEAAAALFQAVEQELSRLSQAVIAMGGVVRIVSMDAETGVVQLNFRGSTKLQQGLELALQDVQGVNAVQFVSSE